ncbi:acyltransferase family protein [Qipengyuania sp.]|uniref:acyltransferase family protein n=1 Tax=Qipengyuania sp. TaxID=2004515 RepID=UPI0035C85B9F
MNSGLWLSVSAPIGGSKRHFYALDLVRGVAALAVALYHYVHFFFPPGTEAPIAGHAAHLPLSGMLSPFYNYGYIAVQIFWMISGFVFAAVYIGREATTRSFVVSRFARLYPLHLITLLVVATLQYVRLASLGTFQIYIWNDTAHLLLQLIFASNWGLQNGHSFNGPIWSVSVEVLIYAVFWLTLPFLYRRGLIGPASACLISHFIWASGLVGDFIGQCAYYFFAGTAVYAAFFLLRKRPLLLPALGIGATMTVVVIVSAAPFGISDILPMILPPSFLLLASFEYSAISKALQHVRWLGDSTYGIYLWHVPIQLLLLLVLDGLVGSRVVVSHPAFLLFYLTLLLTVARLSFIYIERPARSYYAQRTQPRERLSFAT